MSEERDARTANGSLDIHVIIQQRPYDFHSFVRDYRDQIDNHVETCKECHEKMIGWTEHLPKLRARMTAQFPETDNDGERLDQLGQLQTGQCLPCGCEVTDAKWTSEKAVSRFYKALAEIMGVSEEEARKNNDQVRLRDLPLSTKSLRRLRDRFWFPSGSSASEEIRDAEEGDEILQLPETVGQFISEILKLHSGFSYVDCSDHWYP